MMNKPMAKLFLILPLLWSGTLCAQNNGAIFTGVEASSRDYYAYVGTTLPLPGYKLGNGWVQRYWLHTFGYSYPKGNDEIDTTAAGVEAMIGYQGSSGPTWWGAYVGGGYTYRHLSPDDSSSDVSGDQFDLKIQLEGETPISTLWRVNGLLSFAVAESEYGARVRFLRSLSNGTYIGPEFGAMGNSDYRIRSVGVVYGGLKPFGGNTSTNLKAGWKHTNAGNALFAGVEFYIPF